MATDYGQRTTGNIAAAQRRYDLSEKILKLEPDAAPLTVISRSMKNAKKATTYSEFRWAESERLTRFDAINKAAGYLATDDELDVDTGALFKAGMLVKVPRTGEVFEVVSVTTNTLTVTRDIGGSAAALVDNDPLLILGRIAEEGGVSLDAIANDPTTVTNYTEIFKRSVEISGTAGTESNELDPHDWKLQHENEAVEHLVDQEYAYLFGKPDTATSSNGKPVRYTGGALHFATANNVGGGGTLTEAQFEVFLRTGFRYGSQNKTLLASPLLVSVLNNFSQTKLETAVGDSTYGLSVTKWISPHGVVNIVKHNLLEGATYGGYGILLDTGRGNIRYRYLDGGGPLGSRDTKLLTNRQENNRDGQLDEWITEAGLQFGEAKSHAVLTGVTA